MTVQLPSSEVDVCRDETIPATVPNDTRPGSTARVKPTVVQNRFYEKTGYDRDLRAFCRDRGIVYQSFWTLTANPHLLVQPAITEVADASRRTPAQILFRYLTQTGVTPLTGTTSHQHMREALDIFDFTLGTQDCAAIDALLN